MKTCQTFARQESLRELRVPRAQSLYSYRNPFINSQLLPESREKALKKIRKNMELLYDTNALELGFVPDGNWYKWKNSNVHSRMSVACRATSKLSHNQNSD